MASKSNSGSKATLQALAATIGGAAGIRLINAIFASGPLLQNEKFLEGIIMLVVALTLFLGKEYLGTKETVGISAEKATDTVEEVSETLAENVAKKVKKNK